MKKLIKLSTTILLVLTVLIGTATSIAAAVNLTLNKTSGHLDVGETYTLKATVNGEIATGVTWKSSNTGVATISSTGKITARQAGSAILTATASGSSATCQLTVYPAPPLTLNKTSGHLDVGETYTLKATVNGEIATGVTWKSSNTGVATISSAGKITARQAGSATLTATANGNSATCKLTVYSNPIPKLSKTSGYLNKGQTYTLKATVNGKIATGVTWKSSNTGIATISSTGKITAKSPGYVTLTATVNGKSATCALTVYPYNPYISDALETKAERNMIAYKSFVNDIVEYTNKYRVADGAKPVKLDISLTLVASVRSTEMAQVDKLSHTRPNGRPFYTLVKEYGIDYDYVGENIGAYQISAKEVVEEWYASPSHRANMLKKNYTKIGAGVGRTTDGKYYYWTQIFQD